MGKILVFQHVAWEILGTLDPLLKAHNHRIRYVNFGRDPKATPNIADYDALVILGGPMNVDETAKHPHLKFELAAIEAAIKRKMPVLGICLGAQLIAKALGARVKANHTKEIGWGPVALTDFGKSHSAFKNFSEREMIFHWHGDTFEIPSGGLHLARSTLCENQAFSYEGHVLGLQFHLEVDDKLVRRWLDVPFMREEFQAHHPQLDVENFLNESKRLLPRVTDVGKNVFGEFIKLIGACGVKRVRLPSR